MARRAAAAPGAPAGPVGRFVRHARDAGAPPERVLVALKAVLRPFLPADAGRPEGDGLRERVVSDAVRAYYRAD